MCSVLQCVNAQGNFDLRCVCVRVSVQCKDEIEALRRAGKLKRKATRDPAFDDMRRKDTNLWCPRGLDPDVVCECVRVCVRVRARARARDMAFPEIQENIPMVGVLVVSTPMWCMCVCRCVCACVCVHVCVCVCVCMCVGVCVHVCKCVCVCVCV